MNLNLTERALSNLIEATYAISSIVLESVSASQVERTTFRTQFGVEKAKAESALCVIEALVESDPARTKEIRSTLDDIREWVRPDSKFAQDQGERLVSELQRRVAGHLREVKENTASTWLPPRFDVVKMVLDKLVLGLVAAAVLLPLQRCQHLNDLESVQVQKVRQMNLNLTERALSNLTEATYVISSIVLESVSASQVERTTFRTQFGVEKAKAESALYVIEALVESDSARTKEIRSTLDDIREWVRPDSKFAQDQGERLVSELQTRVAGHLREVKENVAVPTI